MYSICGLIRGQLCLPRELNVPGNSLGQRDWLACSCSLCLCQRVCLHCGIVVLNHNWERSFIEKVQIPTKECSREVAGRSGICQSVLEFTGSNPGFGILMTLV